MVASRLKNIQFCILGWFVIHTWVRYVLTHGHLKTGYCYLRGVPRFKNNDNKTVLEAENKTVIQQTTYRIFGVWVHRMSVTSM